MDEENKEKTQTPSGVKKEASFWILETLKT